MSVSTTSREGRAPERRARIAGLAQADGRVKVSQLSVVFGVSTVTIRKDLAVLEAQAHVVRTHGGAVSPGRPEVAFGLRERRQARVKASIAAALLVHDGECVSLDASTSALALARHLRTRGGWSQITVITNGLRIASELVGDAGIQVLVLGGRVRPEAMSMVGPLGDGLLDHVNVQTAFVGAAGFDLGKGLSDATDEEAQIKRSMALAAREVVAIVDSTKWGRSAFATFCDIDKISRVITDGSAPEDMVVELRARGIVVTRVGEECAS